MESSPEGWIGKTFGSSLLGRLLGSSKSTRGSKDDDADQQTSTPVFKYRLGEEPTSPRPGSPGFQEGHWVSVFHYRSVSSLDAV